MHNKNQLAALRRCILQQLYDFFKKHPYAEMELEELSAACETDSETLNWNMVYLEKGGLLELSKSLDYLPYVAFSAAITADGIDLVEDDQLLAARFPLDAEDGNENRD